MDIDELQRKKAELEVRLADALSREVARFREETGHSPIGIDVDMIDSTRLGDSRSDAFVGPCRVILDV